MAEAKKRLTEYANCAGCAGKLPSSRVAEIVRSLPRPNDPNLLVGTETCDDAGVFRIAEALALVQTVDFFPPLVDDPFQFGQIAAANALSDVYAMNGRPLTVMNIVTFPDDDLPESVLTEILRGAADRVQAAGAVTVGGHSLRDTEIKFGLSVTGLVEPAAVLTNASAQAGDVLVLTKPLGTGFITTANKKGECPADALERAIDSMIQLNAVGRDALNAAGGAHAVTDITGFGLAGHAAEMAEGSRLTIELDLDALPVIEGSEPLAVPRYHSRATATNRAHLSDSGRLQTSTRDHPREGYVFDPQTSGGLLISIPPDRADRLLAELSARGARAAAIIGRVVPRRDDTAIVLR